MQLSKDADKLICSIYKVFLEKRKDGEPKSNAKHFIAGFYKDIKSISSWNESDITDTLRELKDAGLVKLYMHGSFQLNDEAIIYMENRFVNGLTDVTDFIAKFIP